MGRVPLWRWAAPRVPALPSPACGSLHVRGCRAAYVDRYADSLHAVVPRYRGRPTVLVPDTLPTTGDTSPTRLLGSRDFRRHRERRSGGDFHRRATPRGEVAGRSRQIGLVVRSPLPCEGS